MSVTGEFQRVLAELVRLLEYGAFEGADAWLAELRECAGTARSDLSAAAARVLALFDGGSPPPRCASALEVEDLARLEEHLGAICHAILGR